MTSAQDELYCWGIELSKLSPRIPGTHNTDRARDFIVDQLRSFGLETWLEPINFRGVFHQDWELRLLSPEEWRVASYPENNVGFGAVDAELVDVGGGTEDDYKGKDVDGKIALINWGSLADHELACGTKKRYPLLASYDAAWSRGAAGIVGYFTDTPGNTLKILEPGIQATGGSNIPGPAEVGEDRQFMLPVLNIGTEDAIRLKALLAQGEVRAHLHISGRRKVSTVWTVVGKLAGRGEDNIIIGAHYCTAFGGAICDTVGVVGALELARRFSQQPLSKRPKTMLFLFSGSHVWLNCNVSSLRFIDQHAEVVPRTVAMLWLDHISSPTNVAGEKRNRRNFPTRFTIMSGNPLLSFLTFVTMMRNKRLPLILPISRLWTMCEMGPFDNLGIPSMTMQTMSDLMLTTEDTWDKIDPHQLARDITVYVDLARNIQRLPGRLLRRLEIPGRSLFGCGVLFSDPSVPEYPEGENYEAEEAPPLYCGGYRRPMTLLRTEEEREQALTEGIARHSWGLPH